MPAKTKLATRQLIRFFRDRFANHDVDRRAVAAFMRTDRKYYTRQWILTPGRYVNLK